MRTRALQIRTLHTPQSLAEIAGLTPGLVLLESAGPWAVAGHFSFLATAPLLIFRSRGAHCELLASDARLDTARGSLPAGLPGDAFPLPCPSASVSYGNPWRLLDRLLARFDLAAELDLPFPAGFCAGFWGYELRQFVEPRLRPHPQPFPVLPDCWLGFYDSLVVFDHASAGVWIISTGLEADGSRSARRRDERLDWWRRRLETPPREVEGPPRHSLCPGEPVLEAPEEESFLRQVRRAQQYIRQGDIYQVNLARCWTVRTRPDPWAIYRAFVSCSPAPQAAYLQGDAFALASASPELFLRMDGVTVCTRPIKGTRPRGNSPLADQALAEALRRSAKERAELTMITDLLRNDLGKVCTYGSVRVPELMRLEQFSHVQHLVSTVEGRLRAGVTHLRALEACFPGGSITGAPKLRAMQIIDELEPGGRGAYTGCLGYLGFNRQSQLSILIRTACCGPEAVWYHAGAGIVADSIPEQEAAETQDKARGFLDCLDNPRGGEASFRVTACSVPAIKDQVKDRPWLCT